MNPQPDQSDVTTALGLLRHSLAEEEQRIRGEAATVEIKSNQDGPTGTSQYFCPISDE
jgi:hypothetical protein